MEISSFFIPTEKLIPFLISSFLLILILVKSKNLLAQRKWFWISSIVFFCVYIFILVYTEYLSNHYYWELQKFDLDGNGFFSDDERTPEQQKAMQRTVKDTARNLAFITGLIYAFIIALLTFIFGRVYEIIRKSIIVKKK